MSVNGNHASMPPRIWPPGAVGMGQIQCPDTPPDQLKTSDDELPVASDDEGTITRGQEGVSQTDTGRGPLREDSDSLPSSSPLSFSSVESAVFDDGSRSTATKPFVGRSESAALWDALGPSPVHTPGPGERPFQYDIPPHLEDGELVIPNHDIKTPPSNQAANLWTDRRRDHRYSNQEHEHIPPSVQPVDDDSSTRRKRNWGGSPASEEAYRSARRPRRAERDDGSETGDDAQHPQSLRTMLGNPWRSGDSTRGRSASFRPVVTSTPRRVSSRNFPNFVPDSGANVSGAPPTPFSAASSGTARGHERSPSRRSNSRSYEARQLSEHRSARESDEEGAPRGAAMDMDLDSSDLLQPRGRSRQEVSRERIRARAWSQGRGPRSLYDIITGPGREDTHTRSEKAEPQWAGGYAPLLSNNNEYGLDHRAPRRAVDDLEDAQHGDVPAHSKSRTPFSAIPHTRAWQHRAGQGASERDDGRRSLAEHQRYEYDRRTEESRMEESLDGSRDEDSWYGGNWGPGSDAGLDEHRDDWYGNEGPTPTALASGHDAEDSPVIVQSPKNAKWHVHFSDPESLLMGLADDWINTIWKDGRPVVVFWVYNYRYTSNGVIHRHIETAVHAITKYITGEEAFCVVPPERDTSRTLPPRELPFLWAIRGLTEGGAKKMMTAHVITTRSVTIITHPRVLSNPRWVCGLGGFLRPNVSIIREAVMSVLASEKMLRTLEELTRSNRRLRHISPEERVSFILDSLEIRMTEADNGEPVANVYLCPPSDDMNLWRTWAAQMRAATFNIFMNGAGKARKVFWCSGCRGVDHETEECRFPEMEGWRGPNPCNGDKLHTTLPVLETSRRKKNYGDRDTRTNAHHGTRGEWQGAGWGTHDPSRGARDEGRANGSRGGGARRGAWKSRTPVGWTSGRGRGGGQGWPGTQHYQQPRW